MKDRFYILRNEDDDDSGGGGGSGDGGSEPSGSLIGSGGQDTSTPAAGTTKPDSSGAFDFRQLINDEGKFVPNFHEKLPENLREHGKHFSKYNDPLQALQHTLNLQQLLGKKADAVVIPPHNASPEEWDPVLKRLGVPDSPDGYGLKIPENLPPGVTVDEAELKGFAELAHKARLTPQQVAILQQYDLDRAAKGASGGEEKAIAYEKEIFAKQKEILTKEWGNGPESVKKMALAERAALTFGFTADEVASDPLFRNARFVMTLAKAGAAMSEDTLAKGGDITSQGGLKAKAQDIINNPDNPNYKKYWNGDEDVVSQVRSWMR